MNVKARREFRVTPDVEFVDVETEDVVYQGEPLTDERVDRIVEDVRRANLRPGGKSLSGDGSHSKPLAVRLPHDVRAQVEFVAKTRGISASKLVREVLGEFLANLEPAPTKSSAGKRP